MRGALAALALALCAPAASAQIIVGQTSGFSGLAATGVEENTRGAKLWFDHVNRNGGIHGKRIELVSLDDAGLPAAAAENASKLITERNAHVLFLNRGTPHAEAIRPLLRQHGVALVAPSSGAMVLHEPVDPWIFNVRSSYQRELEKAVLHLTSLGMRRIALVSVNDSAGADGVAGARKGFRRANLDPVLEHKLERQSPDFAPMAARVAKHGAQAVILIGAAQLVVDGTRAIRAAGSKAQIVTASNNASDGFVKQMAEHARGTIVTQVFPSERSLAVPLIKEAHDLAVASGLKSVTPAMIEGYVGAKVLVEGLRRAGPNPTRRSIRDALERLNRVDIGGFTITYSPTSHTGLEYAELSIIGPSGKFER